MGSLLLTHLPLKGLPEPDALYGGISSLFAIASAALPNGIVEFLSLLRRLGYVVFLRLGLVSGAPACDAHPCS